MKKLIIASTLGVGIIVALWAGPFTSQSFINGQGVVIEQPASATALTVSGTSTSIKYVNDLGQVITAGTNSAGIPYGLWSRPVAVRGNALGDVSTCAIGVVLPPGTSNTVAFSFERSADTAGTYFDTASPWAFTVTGNSNIITAFVTNVPAAFLTGTAYLRLASMVFATNSFGTTNTITSVRLNTFAP